MCAAYRKHRQKMIPGSSDAPGRNIGMEGTRVPSRTADDPTDVLPVNLLRTQGEHRGKVTNSSVLTHQGCCLTPIYDPDPPPAVEAEPPAGAKEKPQRFGPCKYSSRDAAF